MLIASDFFTWDMIVCIRHSVAWLFDRRDVTHMWHDVFIYEGHVSCIYDTLFYFEVMYIGRDFFTCDMTCWYERLCGMTLWYEGRDSYVTWRIHIWGTCLMHMWHRTWLFHVWHDSFVWGTVRYDSLVWGTWLIHMWHDIFVYEGHASFIRDMLSPSNLRALYTTWLIHMWHVSLIWGTWLV